MDVCQMVRDNHEAEGVQELFLELAHACQAWLDASQGMFGLAPVTSNELDIQRAEVYQQTKSEERIRLAVVGLAEHGVELGDCSNFRDFSVAVVSAMDDHLAA